MDTNMIEPRCLIELDTSAASCQADFVIWENGFIRSPKRLVESPNETTLAQGGRLVRARTYSRARLRKLKTRRGLLWVVCHEHGRSKRRRAIER